MRRSIPCMWLLAQDGRSARGLLYLAAVWDDFCQREHRQVRVDTGYRYVGLEEATRTSTRVNDKLASRRTNGPRVVYSRVR